MSRPLLPHSSILTAPIRGWRSALFWTMVVAAGSLLFLLAFCRVVPFDNDEFLQYANLGYAVHPLMRILRYWIVWGAPDGPHLVFFKDAFGVYDLAPFFMPKNFLPLRAYFYVGSFPSLIYAPFFALWRSPVSARLVGLVMMMLQALILKKLFKVNFRGTFLMLAGFMPYAFQHLVDVGQLTFSMTSVYLIAYLARRWAAALKNRSRASVCYPAAIGLLFFIGMWTKLSYFFLIPALLIWTAYELRDAPVRSFSFFMQAALLVAVSAFPTVVLLTGRNFVGDVYYRWIYQGPPIALLDAKAWVERIRAFAPYVLNPLSTAHVPFENSPLVTRLWSVEGLLLVALIVFFFTLGMRTLAKKSALTPFVVGLLCAALTATLTMASTRSWGMHHLVYSYAFVIMAGLHLFGQLDDVKIKTIFLTGFFAVNAVLYAQLPFLRARTYTEPTRWEMMRWLDQNYAKDYAFVFTDWGLFHMQLLYGKTDQIVVSDEHLRDRGQFVLLKDFIARSGRKLMTIGLEQSSADMRMLFVVFPNLVRAKPPVMAKGWTVWMEPESQPRPNGGRLTEEKRTRFPVIEVG